MALGEVGEEAGHRLLGVGLVGPDDPLRPAFDPSDHVLALHLLAGVRLDDAPGVVRDHAAHGVERDARQRDPLVADRPEDEAHRQGAAALGRAGADRAVLALVELVVDDREGLDPLGADDLDRRDEEVQHDPLGRPGERPLGELAQQLQVAITGAVGARRRRRPPRAGRARRPRGPTITSTPGSSPSSFSSLLVKAAWAGPRRPRTWISRIRLPSNSWSACSAMSVGRQQLARAGEDAREVHRHVPVADHGRVLGGEVEAEAAEVRVGVVPAHELGGRVAAGQVLARDPHPPVGARAHRVDDRVVVRRQVGVGEVAPHLNVPVEAELGVGGDLVVDPGHRLDLLVVRGHPAAHQAEGRRQAVVHVDLDLEVVLLLQVLGGVEARGARADHRHSQGVLRRAEGVASSSSRAWRDAARSLSPARGRAGARLKCGTGHARGRAAAPARRRARAG